MYLTQMGYTVETARNGHEAADKLVAEKFDVLLTDLIMPNGSGEELIRAIYASNKFVGLKILAMSGNMLEELCSGSNTPIYALVDGYLLKPFSPQELVDLLNTTNAET
jgi:CheY-like chemotaxis protein